VIETPAGLIVPESVGDVAHALQYGGQVIHHQEPPAEWVRRLREIDPISDVHSWLDLRWMKWSQRWALYECVPIRFVNDDSLIAELAGPDPESPEGAHLSVTRYQQQMYRGHKVHARTSWIIQGEHGGHMAQFGESTKELCRAKGLPTEPPMPGDLPYAPFDERVVAQIQRMNKLRALRGDLAEFKKRYGSPENWKREKREQLRAARKEYVRFINAQFGDDADEFVSAARKGELDDAPRTEKDFVKENEDADEKYVETGRF
jgi:hypothetical protein